MESKETLELPMLRLVTRKEPMSTEMLKSALHLGHDFLGLENPFVVLYDVRNLTRPTRSQIKVLMSWVPLHSESLDRNLQGVGVILSNTFVRLLINVFLKAFKPPQPVIVASSEEAVMDFFAKRCQQVKNWPAEAGKGRRAERTPTQPPSIGPPSIAPSMGRRAVSEGALTSISKTSISKTDEEALYTALHMGGGVDRFSSVT